jgi:cation transport ATPase
MSASSLLVVANALRLQREKRVFESKTVA